jgi:hypothetical protein
MISTAICVVGGMVLETFLGWGAKIVAWAKTL